MDDGPCCWECSWHTESTSVCVCPCPGKATVLPQHQGQLRLEEPQLLRVNTIALNAVFGNRGQAFFNHLPATSRRNTSYHR